jgi:mannose-6-phosphate isomerase-like protein (cupin superfamily)
MTTQTEPSYPGQHADVATGRGAVIDLNGMDWTKVAGKVEGIVEKPILVRAEHESTLWVSKAKVLPGGVFPSHYHPYPQVFVFLEGQGVVELDGKRIDVKAGMVVRMLAGESHQVRNESDEDLVLMQISVPGWREEEQS